MNINFWLLGCTTLLLTSCGEIQSGNGDPSGRFIMALPQGVLAVAAPYQDLKAVQIDQSNGCYVYRHVGPVESTYLPLRTVEGRPICTRPAEAVEK